MKKEVKQKKQREYQYYILLALVFILPLIFSTAVQNMFDAVKSSVFRILGGFFIIVSVIFLWNKLKKNQAAIIINKQLDIALTLFFVSAVISTIFSINPYVSFFGQYWRQIGLITYTALLLIYFFVSSALTGREKIDKIFFAMEITAVISAVYAILQFFGLDPFDIQKIAFVRAEGTLGASVFSAGFLLIVLPFAVIRNFQKKVTVFSVLVPVIILIGIVVLETRTTYMGFIAELILFLIFYPYMFKPDIDKFKKARKISYIILGTALLMVAAVNILLPENIFIKRFQSVITITETQRWRLWETTFRMFWKYPFTGTGISTFSNALEDFLTIDLKRNGAFGYYDNAHNNFIHTLAVMGIAGLGAYLYLLYTGVKNSVSMILKQRERKNKNFVYLAFLCMLGGYIVYGLADFDEITILTYMFIFFAIIKIELFTDGTGTLFKPEYKLKVKYKNSFAVTAFIIILFSLYNIYNAYIDFKAEKAFFDGLLSYNSGNFNGFNEKINEALDLNPRAEYLYSGGYYSYLYCFDNFNMPGNNKKAILQSAENRIKEAEKNYPSLLECYSMLSLIKFEEGDSLEGERIKSEVLAKDTLQTTFRVNLARYYFRNKNRDKAFDELKFIYKYDPYNIDAYITSIVYLIGNKEYQYAENCCNIILGITPGHPAALYYLDEIKRLKSANK